MGPLARIVRLSGEEGSPLRWEEVAIFEPGEAVTQHDEEDAEDAEDARTRRRGTSGTISRGRRRESCVGRGFVDVSYERAFRRTQWQADAAGAVHGGVQC